jgi:hypothetical protein
VTYTFIKTNDSAQMQRVKIGRGMWLEQEKVVIERHDDFGLEEVSD